MAHDTRCRTRDSLRMLVLAALAGFCMLGATGCSSHTLVTSRGERIVFAGNSHFDAARLVTIAGLDLT